MKSNFLIIIQKILYILVFLVSMNAYLQEKSLYMKGNALFLPIGVVNTGLEYQLSRKYTLQADGFISPWKSFLGRHAQIYMGHLEGRYYFEKAFNKWYVGVNIGMGVFDITKWNYKPNNQYQRGFNYMIGGTIGYQFRWKKRWNIDVFLGGGTSQGFYHGYEQYPTLKRYDSATHWNKSGEFLPYRGGVMISYQLK